MYNNLTSTWTNLLHYELDFFYFGFSKYILLIILPAIK